MIFQVGHIPWNMGKHLTEKTKKRMSQVRQKENNPFFGRHHSEEAKHKISMAHLGNIGHNRGKHLSEATKKKISESRLGTHWSEDSRKKASESHKGKKWSEEQMKKEINARLGEKSHFWRGGLSFIPYTTKFNSLFKKEIRERDGYCMLCHINLDDLHLLKRRVCVHHIDYDKSNTFPQNCITLCINCHVPTNFNREKWIPLFHSLLSEQYGYKYTESQKILLDFTNKEVKR